MGKDDNTETEDLYGETGSGEETTSGEEETSQEKFVTQEALDAALGGVASKLEAIEGHLGKQTDLNAWLWGEQEREKGTGAEETVLGKTDYDSMTNTELVEHFTGIMDKKETEFREAMSTQYRTQVAREEFKDLRRQEAEDLAEKEPGAFKALAQLGMLDETETFLARRGIRNVPLAKLFDLSKQRFENTTGQSIESVVGKPERARDSMEAGAGEHPGGGPLDWKSLERQVKTREDASRVALKELERSGAFRENKGERFSLSDLKF